MSDVHRVARWAPHVSARPSRIARIHLFTTSYVPGYPIPFLRAETFVVNPLWNGDVYSRTSAVDDLTLTAAVSVGEIVTTDDGSEVVFAHPYESVPVVDPSP